jgi:hypothetical protein
MLETELSREETVAVPICTPQIPQGLARDGTRPFAVGGRLLTASVTARQLCENVPILLF